MPTEAKVVHHSRRTLLLPQLHLPYDGSDLELLLPQQSGGTHSTLSPQTSSSSSPPRPIRPTPCRMMSSSNVLPQTQPKRHKRRESGIPRPASGSSRQATSASFILQSASTTADKPAAIQASGTDPTTLPPSSWRTLQPGASLAESQLPCSQRRQDLTSLKQQLRISHYSTQSISSPSKIGSPREPSLPMSSSISNSTKSSSLVSLSRDITPRRRLMKPLSPPLPKSQSIGIVSCFASPTTTPSPSKIKIYETLRYSAQQPIQVDVVGALFESRMTDEEIVSLNQVQKEAAINHHRLRNSYVIGERTPKTPIDSSTPSTAFTRKAHAATTNLSPNDVADTERLEEQRTSISLSRPLFINSMLANTCCLESDQSTPSAFASTITSSPDDDWEVNLKLVHFAEPAAYWAGRYMTICDRLRMEQMLAPVTASPASAGSSDTISQSADAYRMRTALEKLRSRCRTTQALNSFKLFEAQMIKSSFIPPPTKNSITSKAMELDSENEMKLFVVQKKTQGNLLASRHNEKQFSETLTPTKLEPPLPNIWSRLALPKSKTTSNLVSMQSASMFRPPTPTRKQPKLGERLSPCHAHRTSKPRETPELATEALKNMCQIVKTPASMMQRRVSGVRISSYSSNSSEKSQGKKLSTSKTMPHLCKASTAITVVKTTRIARLSEFDNVSENLTCAALETGCPPPPPVPANTSAPASKMVNGEKSLKSRRRSERKSSGEIIKGVFDAGVSQMKKMSKRVGGSMSWVGSQEDLAINVLATGTK